MDGCVCACLCVIYSSISKEQPQKRSKNMNRTREKCSPSLVIKENQIKTKCHQFSILIIIIIFNVVGMMLQTLQVIQGEGLEKEESVQPKTDH